uniref:LAM_G_DOMAIN domain-containing protein n=1 Tax=Meloidogyne hapla TaxID=6305 RepID=A0A1I8BCV2_MELHA
MDYLFGSFSYPYLLFSNHIIHPSKLLADGLWHTIHLHLHSLSVRIDNLGTSLSLRESSDSGEPKWIDILVHGEVAAIRILDSNGNDRGEEKWICNDLTNNDFLEVRQSLPQQHIFSQPAACAPSTLEQNFCNCKGPNSALIQNGGFSRNSQIAKCSLLPNDENCNLNFLIFFFRLLLLD